MSRLRSGDAEQLAKDAGGSVYVFLGGHTVMSGFAGRISRVFGQWIEDWRWASRLSIADLLPPDHTKAQEGSDLPHARPRSSEYAAAILELRHSVAGDIEEDKGTLTRTC